MQQKPQHRERRAELIFTVLIFLTALAELIVDLVR